MNVLELLMNYKHDTKDVFNFQDYSDIEDISKILSRFNLINRQEVEDFIERSGIMMDGNHWDQEQADKAAFEQILLRRKRYNLN